MNCRFCGKEIIQKEGKWVCSGCGFKFEQPSSDMLSSIQITPQAAQTEIDSGRAVLIDVREKWEFDLVHLPNAILISLGELASKLHLIPKDKPVIVYCHHGNRSLLATQFLRQKGYTTVKNLTGGINGYSLDVDYKIKRY